MKLYTGHKHGCAPVTGRLVRLRGLAFLVCRHPVTGWTYFCVDEDTLDEFQVTSFKLQVSEADGQARTNAKRKA